MTDSRPSLRAADDTRDSTERPRWWREPLLHFFMLGVVLFAVDRLVAGDTDDARTIYVDAAVDREAREIFAAARGREPNEDELYALRQVWLDNEVLYREGLALGLDQGDETIRERVIFKALSLVNAGLKAPAADDDAVRAWFEKNRARYDAPARFDFNEAVLVDAASDAAVREFVASLNGGAPAHGVQAGLRVFKARPHDNLVQSYGEEFAAKLERLPVGEWHALPSKEGLRAVQLVAVSAPQPADYDDLLGIVRQDWLDAMMTEQRTAAVRALARKYEVKVEPVEAE